jgi:hypothetical protein
VNYRLRGCLGGLLRLLVFGLGLGLILLGWRAFLHLGPRGERPPAMYLFHAKALIHHRLAFPRPASQVYLPAPQSMSSADVQLRLMKWWDGKHWLPEALAHGEAAKGGLQLHAGELTLVEVTGVSPAETKDGITTCVVRARVRWDVPPNLQELIRVREIVALRFPKGPLPGQIAEMTCAFTRKGWAWELVSAESPWGGRLPASAQSPDPMRWIF